MQRRTILPHSFKPNLEQLERREQPSVTAAPAGAVVSRPLPEVAVLDKGEANDSRGGALNFGTIGPATKSKTGSVGGSDPRDYYKFRAPHGSAEIKLTGLKQDIDFEVLRSNGTRFRTASRGGNKSESETVKLAGGTYYIKVYPGVKGARSDYKLSVREVVPSGAAIFEAVKPLINALLPTLEDEVERELENAPAADLGGQSVDILSANVNLNNLRRAGDQIKLDVDLDGRVRAEGSEDLFDPFFGRKIGSVSGEARAVFTAHATITIAYEDGALSARASTGPGQRATISDIRVDRISNFGGAVARALGDALVSAADAFAPQLRINIEAAIRENVVDRINERLENLKI
jgi:hypothetical protein